MREGRERKTASNYNVFCKRLERGEDRKRGETKRRGRKRRRGRGRKGRRRRRKRGSLKGSNHSE